jgi:hypothetical protein
MLHLSQLRPGKTSRTPLPLYQPNGFDTEKEPVWFIEIAD